MSDALTPLRRAYGVEPSGPPGPDGSGDVEVTLLRQMRAVLDEMPRPSPSAAAVSAVRDAAAVDPLAAVRAAYDEADAPAPSTELAVLRQTAEAVDRAFRQGPRPRPSEAVVEAVLSRAAEVSARPPEPAVADPSLGPLADALGLVGAASHLAPAETAVLTQSLDLLDARPAPRPSAEALAAVRAFALAASEAALAPVRTVYEEDAPAGTADPVETALLRQSREVIEQALATRPQPRPPAATVTTVLARAAEASGLDPGEAVTEPTLAPLATALGIPLADDLAADPVETAVLEQSLAALDTRPVSRPVAGALDGALARASEAEAEAESVSPPRRSLDRSPAPPPRARRAAGMWAGVGGLLAIALVAVLALPRLLVSPEAPARVAALADATVPVPAPSLEVEPAAVEAPSSTLDDGTPPREAPTSAAPAPALVAAVVEPAPPPRSSPAPSAARALASATPPSATARSGASVPEWEVNDDVRALSLRLHELDRGTAGLGWDAPAEALGAPGTSGPAHATPGLQVVREGATPARARLRPDSTRQQR